MTRNAIRWLTEEYFAVIPKPNGRDTSHISRVLLLNELPDGRWRCCGGFREHFAECKELCCFCGQGLAWSGWNARWGNGPNGFPAHPGCLEDRGWDAYRDRVPDDEPVDLDDDSRTALYDQDAL